MSREDPQLKVRLPQELKDKITESASNLGRSINADVVARLEESFNQTNKNLEDLSADEVIYFIFNKLNSRGLSLTIEEIERSKKLRKSPEK